MTIPWLADELRTAGLTVVEHAGWKTRMAGSTWTPRFGVVHATAAPRTQSDETQVRIVRDGREGLPGPIANACVDRQGRWHVLAVGRCNTTLIGTAGPFQGLGNTYALGIEACNDNLSEPWAQYGSYYRGWAAICRRLGWTASNLVGHKEHTPGHKTDPTFSMGQFRTDVARVLAGGDDVEATEILNFTYDDGSTLKNNIHNGYLWTRQIVAQLPALTAAVQTLAEAQAADRDITPEELTAAVQTGVTQAGDALTAVMVPALVAGLTPHMAGASEEDVERIVTDIIGGVRLVPEPPA